MNWLRLYVMWLSGSAWAALFVAWLVVGMTDSWWFWRRDDLLEAMSDE